MGQCCFSSLRSQMLAYISYIGWSGLVHRAVHFLPTCGANPAMSLLCLWLAAWKMRVRLDWGFGTCKREFVQACVCTSINRKNLLVASLFAASSLEGESVWIEVTGVRGRFFGLWMCKHKLGQIPFCTCKDPNPNTLSSSKLLAPSKEATLHHVLRMWAKTGNQKLCVLHGALM